MILIGENLHVISPTVRIALTERDETFVKDLVKLQSKMDYLDLNVGPAKNKLDNIFSWLYPIVNENSDANVSFDTTNIIEMRNGLEICKNPENAIINSTSADDERLEKISDLAAEFGSNLVALTLNKEIGIPKSADGRLELAFEIYEKCAEKGIENEKIFFDPLILPVAVEQSQAVEALNTLKMLKESFDPPAKTVIGLSNISNGAPKNMRPLINRVFFAMAHGAGLDAVIMDAADEKLINLAHMLDSQHAETAEDKLYLDLADMIAQFSDLEDICYDSNDQNLCNIFKCARILLNKEIYSHSFTQV